MAYYITGDCHGQFRKIELFCQNYHTDITDVMIILGDVGINYWLNKMDDKLKRMLAKLPITFLCIAGNHEERPYNISTYEEIKWKDGIVYREAQFPNLLFAKDGEIYTFGEKRAIVIGGAYSVDKEYRLYVGLPWFKEEQPSDGIKEYVEVKLEENNWKVDYVLSHTCPLCYEPTDLFLDFLDQSKVDKSTEEWLTKIEKRLEYQKWYFGHFHGNREYYCAEMLFETIKELGCEDVLQRVGNPKFQKGELAIFNYDSGGEKKEIYGRIEVIDAYGTLEQSKEVSYDILGTDNIWYKHIPESDVFGLSEL